MKKIIAILMTVCLIASALCVAAAPASAGGYGSVFVCGYSYDGREWAIGIHGDFDEAWNEAVYYSTRLEEAWNSSVRFETEAERPEVEGFSHIVLHFYDNWNADSMGSFGTGIGFKDGAIYAPKDAKITVHMNGYSINSDVNAKGNVMYVDSGADVKINRGTIVGDIYTDRNAMFSTNNVNFYSAKDYNGSAHTASISGEGSLPMIVSLLALAASVASICLTVAYNKKRTAPATASNAKDSDSES